MNLFVIYQFPILSMPRYAQECPNCSDESRYRFIITVLDAYRPKLTIPTQTKASRLVRIGRYPDLDRRYTPIDRTICYTAIFVKVESKEEA